jgi:hypothetical protein
VVHERLGQVGEAGVFHGLNDNESNREGATARRKPRRV